MHDDRSTRERSLDVDDGRQVGTDEIIGKDVVGADGDKVGRVIASYPGYLVVEKGFFFPTDYYVPTSAVAASDDDGVTLNLTKDEALHQGWDQVPAELSDDLGTRVAPADDTDIAPMATSSAPVPATGPHGHADPFDHRVEGDLSHDDSGGTVSVELHAEEATATTRERDLGQVRIEKQIVTEDQTLDVPVIEERLRVERRPVDREVDAGVTLEERTLSVPIRGEVVDVEKTLHVVEEVSIQKEAVERTTAVETTVRHEELRVDESGAAEPGLVTERGDGTTTPGSRDTAPS